MLIELQCPHTGVSCEKASSFSTQKCAMTRSELLRRRPYCSAGRRAPACYVSGWSLVSSRLRPSSTRFTTSLVGISSARPGVDEKSQIQA